MLARWDLLKDFGTISQWGQPYHLYHVLQSWSLGLFGWSDTVSVTSFTAEHPKLMKLQVRFIQQEDVPMTVPDATEHRTGDVAFGEGIVRIPRYNNVVAKATYGFAPGIR